MLNNWNHYVFIGFLFRSNLNNGEKNQGMLRLRKIWVHQVTSVNMGKLWTHQWNMFFWRFLCSNGTSTVHQFLQDCNSPDLWTDSRYEPQLWPQKGVDHTGITPGKPTCCGATSNKIIFGNLAALALTEIGIESQYFCTSHLSTG